MICQPFPSSSAIEPLCYSLPFLKENLSSSPLAASSGSHLECPQQMPNVKISKGRIALMWKLGKSSGFHAHGGHLRHCVKAAALANRSIEAESEDVSKAFLKVQNVSYRPPGTETLILQNLNLSLPAKSMGLVYGKSGSGKTTLLQILAGLVVPTEGYVQLGHKANAISSKNHNLSDKVGIVFQFPERYFLTDSIIEELTFGWPKNTDDLPLRQELVARVEAAILSVGLSKIPLNSNPRALSDGYKRRLSLAVQFVRMPELLLLDEPLAGLDWNARADVIKVLRRLKQEQTLVVVSHDLKEIMQLVDKAWRMEMGGVLTEQKIPLEI